MVKEMRMNGMGESLADSKNRFGTWPASTRRVQRQTGVPLVSNKSTLRIVPSVVFVSETAILWARVPLVVISIVAIVVACLPVRRLIRYWRIELPRLVFVLTFLRGERIIEVVHCFGIVRLRPIWVETFSNLFFLPFFGVRVP